MKQRRNPFQNATQPPQSIYDNLRVAERRQRNRRWEKATYQNKAVYRGVDPHLALRVKEIAGDLLVNSGEVARMLLEYALRAYAECELELNPRPHPEREHWTLYPAETISERHSRSGSQRKPKKQAEARWKVLTTWRGFPVDLKNEIAALASEDGLNVPVGELVSALLRFSLKAYEYGLLKLEPVQKLAGYTLLEEAQS
jgi:hypothetical protein